MSPPPTKPQIHHALTRAATIRRNRYRDDDRYQHYTDAALEEQVCGVEGIVNDLGDGWWLVGTIVDVIAGVELEVLCRPGETIRVREIVEVERQKSPPKPLLPERLKPMPVSTERGSNPLKWDEW
jgi:hypothetical protein